MSQLYNTFSLCAECALIDKKGFDQIPASVIHDPSDNCVYLISICATHGQKRTMISSSALFYLRMLKFGVDPMQPISSNDIDEYASRGAPPAPDIEDLYRSLTYTPASKNLPLVVEILVVRGAQGFVSDDELTKEVHTTIQKYPKGRQFVVRLAGKLAADMIEFNRKVHLVESLLPPRCRVLIELSFERLIALSAIDDSALLNARVYPNVKYYVTPGAEEQCVAEFKDLFASLSAYGGLQTVVTITVDRPFADLGKLLPFFRERAGMVHFLVINLERSPKALVTELMQRGKSGADSDSADSVLAENDIYALVKHVCECSDGLLKESDFLPAAAGRILEPFLKFMGYGQFSIRPSPFCAFGAVVANSNDPERAKPVGAFLDLERLYFQLLPLLDKLEASDSLGFFNAQRIKRALKQSAMPGVQLPDLLDFLLSKTKAAEVKAFVARLQFIVVHNNMDLFAMDFRRRCHCATVNRSDIPATGLAAACSGGCV